MQARIQQLESLVVTLMQQSKSVTREDSAVPLQATCPHEMDNRADEISSQSDHGSIKFNNFGNSSYVNGSHWVAVLDGIAELKDYFEYEEREPVQPAAFSPTSSASFVGPQLLLGCPYYTTREQVLASLPGKPEVDRLVSFYFNSFDMSPGKY